MKYDVQLRGTITEVSNVIADVEVEANSPEEACQKARELAAHDRIGRVDWEDDPEYDFDPGNDVLPVNIIGAEAWEAA